MNWEKFCRETGRDMARKITEVYGTDKAHKEHGKGKGGDITIEGDKVSEEILLEHLKKLDQDIYLISEEVGHMKLGDFNKPKDAEYTILVDPLDGSFNFKKRMDHFAVSIGVLDKNYEPTAGYVRDVPRGLEYYAEKGKGAFLDGDKIETRKDSGKANILLEASPRASRGDIEFLSKAFLNTRRARAYGSVALDLCRVADGTFHSFLYAGCSRYLDVTAGLFIVKEAGGVVTDFNGNEQLTKRYELIANNILASGNKKIHNKLLKNRPLSKKK